MRYKIEIIEHNNFFHQFEDGTAIGGSYGEPIHLKLSLNEKEFKTLLIGMGNYSDLRHDLALMYFVRTICISEWHKRIIRHTFKGSLSNIEIKFL